MPESNRVATVFLVGWGGEYKTIGSPPFCTIFNVPLLSKVSMPELLTIGLSRLPNHTKRLKGRIWSASAISDIAK